MEISILLVVTLYQEQKVSSYLWKCWKCISLTFFLWLNVPLSVSFSWRKEHSLRTLIILLLQDDHHRPFTELLILFKHDNIYLLFWVAAIIFSESKQVWWGFIFPLCYSSCKKIIACHSNCMRPWLSCCFHFFWLFL